MTLRTQQFTITDAGRDKGKVFVLTEMAARPAHRWATRVLFAAMNSGADVPDDMAGAGMAGIAALAIKALAKIPYEVAEPMLDELLLCVQFMPEPGKPNVVRALFDGDVQEASTFFRLQKEVVTMHVAPFISGATSTTASAPSQTEQAGS